MPYRDNKNPGEHPSSDEIRTKSDGAAASDVNTLMAQYARNGTLPRVTARQPLYGDFTGPQDLHSQREAVFAAQERYELLPAAVRDASSNDAVRFLEMLEDPQSLQVLLDAGLDPSLEASETESPAVATPTEPEGEDTTPPEGGGE